MVRYLSDRIAVLYLGRIEELGSAETVFDGAPSPLHRGAALGGAQVEGEPSVRIRLEGEIPSASDPPSGCVFHTRCPRFMPGICEVTEPPLAEVEPGHMMRCHIPIEELRVLQARAAATADPAP